MAISVDYKKIVAALQKIHDALDPLEEEAKISLNNKPRLFKQIDSLAPLVKYPKIRVWYDFEFDDLSKVFRSDIHTLISINEEHVRILGNLTYLDYYFKKLQQAKRSGHLSLYDQKVMLAKIIEIGLWVHRGFVEQKQFSTISLDEVIQILSEGKLTLDNILKNKDGVSEVINEIKEGLTPQDIGTTMGHLQDVTRELTNRLRENEIRIASSVRKRAQSTYAEYRLRDISVKTAEINKRVKSRDFDEAVEILETIDGEYFSNTILIEPGLIRAMKRIRYINHLLQKIRRKTQTEEPLDQLLDQIRFFKEDIEHSKSFLFLVTLPSGDTFRRFETRGISTNGLLSKLKSDGLLDQINKYYLVSYGSGWIDANQTIREKRLSDETRITFQKKSNPIQSIRFFTAA